MTSGSVAPSTPWFRPLGAVQDQSPTLFLLPHAGGSATSFAPLAAALASALPVYAVQYPGRQDRIGEPLPQTIQELADDILDASSVWFNRPVALFGHSMGAAVGYELVTRLQSRGAAPVHLFISGRRGPQVLRNERVHLLDDDAFADELVRLGATQRELVADPEMRELLIPMVRSDYRAIETYRCTQPTVLDVPITVLTGEDDPYVTPDEAAQWSQHTAASFVLHQFPGAHFFLFEHQAAVAGIVLSTLVGAPSDRSRSSAA